MGRKDYRKHLSLRRMLSQESADWSMGSSDSTVRTELKDQGIQGVDTKLLRELGEDNVDQAIIGEEIAQLSEEYDLRAITWRQRMIHFLHRTPVEIFMISLVVLDVLIILSMVVLDMYILGEELLLTNIKGTELLGYFNESWPNVAPEVLNSGDIDHAYEAMIKRNAGAHNTSHGSDSHVIHKRASGGHGSPNTHDYGSQESYDAAKMIHESTTANHILHYCSIAILAVFVVEVGLKIIGYGTAYFKNKWEMIDGLVIIISFSLDVAVTDVNFSHEVGKTVIVVFLIWRVIRILNAMVLTSRARTMFRLRVLRKSKKISEDKNKQLNTDIADLQAEVKRLRDLAREYGAEDHEIVSAQVLSKTTVSSTKAGLKNMMAQLLHLNTKIATGFRKSTTDSVNVSCSSLNKLKVGNGYNRSRRPSMIGDQTMCHDAKLASQLSEYSTENPPSQMRPRAASDAGGMTNLSKKLRENLAGFRSKRRGSSAFSQTDVSVSLSEKLDESPPSDTSSLSTGSTPNQTYSLVNECSSNQSSTKPDPNLVDKTSKQQAADEESVFLKEMPDKVLADIHEQDKSDSVDGGHTNQAYSSDDAAGGRRNSDGSGNSGDSGYSASIAASGRETAAQKVSNSDQAAEGLIKQEDSPPVTRANVSNNTSPPQSSSQKVASAANIATDLSNGQSPSNGVASEVAGTHGTGSPKTTKPPVHFLVPQISVTPADDS